MDPLTIGLSAVGLGMQLFGGMSASTHAKEAHNVQTQIAGLENQVNQQRKVAMELSARRQSMEIFRTNQRARAMAINNATTQGASYGNSSGLQGGLAQVDAQSMFNLQGVNQNLELGRNIFGINDQISKQKLSLSDIQSSMMTDQSISGMGSTLMKNAGTISNIAGAGFSAYGNSQSMINPYNTMATAGRDF